MSKQEQDWWNMEIMGMPDFDMSMKRIHAWFEGEILDRPPVRFVAHNAFLEMAQDKMADMTAAERQACWFDVEYQVNIFEKSIAGQKFNGETFPVFFPNLGPDVYAGFFGTELEFGEVTSWSIPLIERWDQVEQLQLDMNHVYFKKIEELTTHALNNCTGRYLVGYTDIHPGLDCVAAWRNPQQLCIDMIDSPEQVKLLVHLAISNFEPVYDHFDRALKQAGQLSVTWMGIPTFGRLHIPSCDFSTMISQDFFNEFGLPLLQREVKTMTHNIFHVDGKGVARHLDAILSVPEVHAIQWVQGVGDDFPIMQWVPLIKEIQARKPVIVDLDKRDLDDFMAVMEPEGLFLWIATKNEQEEIDLLKRIHQWS